MNQECLERVMNRIDICIHNTLFCQGNAKGKDRKGEKRHDRKETKRERDIEVGDKVFTLQEGW